MNKKLEEIKNELIAQVREVHHHDAHYSKEENYHVDFEGEVYEEEIINIIEEVFAKALEE